MRIATWNVNSLRVRLAHVLEWLAMVKPDVLALQETKLPDDIFPHEEFRQVGYFADYSGQRTYNGVAILSRVPGTERVTELGDFNDPQRRVLASTIADIRIINIYVPNGESITSDKFRYKLDWLKALDVFLKDELQRYPKLVVVGDFNIAPEEQDVYDPKALENNILFSAPERAVFQGMLALGLNDCFRLHTQPDKSFSWWDYRLNAFKRNMGLRIDHILASTVLAASCQLCKIDKTVRALERPSDHAPVVAEFLT